MRLVYDNQKGQEKQAFLNSELIKAHKLNDELKEKKQKLFVDWLSLDQKIKEKNSTISKLIVELYKHKPQQDPITGKFVKKK